MAFLSQGRLDPSVNNNWQEIYIRDRVAGTTTLVRPAADGSLSNTGIRFADISADGRFVAFQTNSDNIVVPDANGFVHDVFVKDLVTGTTILVSQATDGTQGNHDSWMPAVSADGRYVAFHSWANNLVPGDTNTQPFYDIFVRDTVLGTTTRLNLTPIGGEADGTSVAASISADGSLVSFESTATNLVPNDVNGGQDVFLAGPPYPGAAGTSFQFSVSSYSAAEAGGSAAVTVTRTGPLCTTATVQYATSDGTATAGADYVAASGTLTFLAGETSHSFAVTLLDDAEDEPDETVALALSNPTGGPTLGDPSAATLTILDDDVPQNSPPDAVDDAAATNEDTPVVIDVLANDSDPDGDPLAITAFSQGAHGSVAGNGDGTLTYTPAPNVFGGDAFTYTIDNGNGGTDSATVTITVAAVNDPPVAVGETYGMGKDTTLTVAAPGVLGNDSDIDSPMLTAVLVTGPANGALALSPDGSFTYTPANGFVGNDAFTYQANDGLASSNTATVSIVVAGFMVAPVAGTTTPIPGGTGTFTAFPGGPLAGAGAVGFIGLGGGGQQGLYATLAGGQPPIRLADLATPIPGGSGAFTALREPSLSFQPGDPCHEAAFVGDGANGQQGIYAASFGDASCSGAPLTLADLSTAIPGGSGAFTALREPSLGFQPGDPCQEAAFVGDGAGGQQGIYAASFGDASCSGVPVTLADLSTAISGGSGAFTALREPSLGFQPGDPCQEAAFIGDGANGQQGIYAASFGDTSCSGVPITLADLSTAIPGGTGAFTALREPSLAFQPGDPCQEAAFIGDGAGGQQGIYATSFGDESCSGASIKVADSATSIPQGQGTFTGFLALSASQGHTAFLATGSGGQKGIYLASTLTKVVDLSDTIDGKTLADLRFDRGGLSGNQLTFAATFSDGSQGVFSVSVDFSGVNDPPLASPDSYTTNEDTPLAIAAPGVLGNDADPEGGSLSAALVSGPAGGSLSLGADGSFTYTPNANFNGSDSFTYEVSDPGGVESNLATVTITVQPVNDPPVAANDAHATAEDTTLVVPAPGVLGNDSDTEGSALTATLVSGPAFGALSLNADGSFSYTPAANFSGSDAFSYRANDGSLPSNTATVTIQVSPVNDPPVAVNDSYTTNQGTALTVAPPGVLGNDLDAEGGPLTAALASGPTHGALSLNANGSFTYTPHAGFVGNDNFTYRASDGQAMSGPATVGIVVQAVSGPTWSPTGSLNVARTAHAATLLPNGKVLAAGGYGPSGILKSAELYNPATGTWSATGNLQAARTGHTAVLLPNGKVLVTGGIGASGILKSAELYNPATGTWSATGNLQAARAGHTAEVLSNGKVLVAGGVGTSGILKSAELYNPATGTWSATGNLAVASALHTATRLPDGRVLIAGGVGAAGSLARAELYAPGAGTWTQAGSLAVARSLHTATRLPDGRVLAAGGFGTNAQPLNGAEVFDPATARWNTTASLNTARGSHTATLLPTGKVLAAGGGLSGLASAELFGSP